MIDDDKQSRINPTLSFISFIPILWYKINVFLFFFFEQYKSRINPIQL